MDDVNNQVSNAKKTTLQQFFKLYQSIKKQQSPKSAQDPNFTLKTDSKSYPVLNSAGVTVKFNAPEQHSDTDWVGCYPVGTPSGPGLSDGCWLYVPVGAAGELHFKPFQLPKIPGTYEFRYHTGGYTPVATCTLTVVADQTTANTRVTK